MCIVMYIGMYIVMYMKGGIIISKIIIGGEAVCSRTSMFIVSTSPPV